MRRLVLVTVAALSLAACSKPAEKAAEAPAGKAPAAVTEAAKVDIPAGAYVLDKAHSTLLFKVSHMGFSAYTAQFTDFDVKLQLDPANPSTATLDVTVDPTSLSLPNPPQGFKNELLGPDWLDAKAFPAITYRSTGVMPAEGNTALITGDLTLHGVTKPVVLKATFNGGYRSHPMDPRARAGFSGEATFKRSDFGLAFGVPAPGTTMGVGDEVTVIIETEFTGPPPQP